MSKIVELTRKIEVEADQAVNFANLGWYVSEAWHSGKLVEELYHDITELEKQVRLAELRLLRMRSNQAAMAFDGIARAIDRILDAAEGEE